MTTKPGKALMDKKFMQARARMQEDFADFMELYGQDAAKKRELALAWLKALTPYFLKLAKVPGKEAIEKVPLQTAWDESLWEECTSLARSLWFDSEKRFKTDQAEKIATALHNIAAAASSLVESWKLYPTATIRNSHYALDGSLEGLGTAAYDADFALPEDTGAMQYQLLTILRTYLP